MLLIPLWDVDLDKAYELQRSFPPEENGFVNAAYGMTREKFAQYVRTQKGYSQGRGLPEGYVPCTVYVLVDDQNNYVGLFNLRHCLNDTLRQGAGHIGYGIRSEYRGRGYASAGLRLLLREAWKIVPEEEIYLSVHKDNPASLQVQKNNGATIHYEDTQQYYTRIRR